MDSIQVQQPVQARSVIALGMSYAPATDPLALAATPDRARISVYAQGRDYHDTVKKALKALARWLVAEAAKRGLGEAGVKVFVDTAPVMEKPLGQAAGLGWQGKHTNLVSQTHGSWLFLGAIYTTLDFTPAPKWANANCGRLTTASTLKRSSSQSRTPCRLALVSKPSGNTTAAWPPGLSNCQMRSQ